MYGGCVLSDHGLLLAAMKRNVSEDSKAKMLYSVYSLLLEVNFQTFFQL